MATSRAITEAVEQLLDSDLCDSALQLAELECTPRLADPTLPIAERLQLLDTLSKSQQSNRHYRRALMTLTKFVSGPARAQLSRDQLEGVARDIANIRWQLKEYDMCLAQLRQIPTKHRRVQDIARMAKCAALVNSPDAADLHEALLEAQPNAADGNAYHDVKSLTVANSLVARLAYAEAIKEFQKMLRRHRDSAPLLAQQATCHYMLNDKALLVDPSLMLEMGTYSDLLQSCDQDAYSVYQLGTELLKTDETRPEGWVAMARYLMMAGQMQEALAIVWKAQTLAPDSADAFYAEGAIQMASECPEEAAEAYLKAHSLRRSALTYRGIMDAYLQCGRYKDAFVVAKEAAELMPNHAGTLAMIGRVLSHSPESYDRAVALLKSALQIDRRSSLYGSTGQHSEAIAMMEKFLPENESDALYTVYADILTLANELPRAAGNLCERTQEELDDEIGEPIDEPLPPSDQDDMMLAMMREEQGSPLGRSFTDSDEDGNFYKSVKWSPDGTSLAAHAEDNALHIYNVCDIVDSIAQGSPAAIPHAERFIDFSWYPYMHHATPSTCCLVESTRDHPLHLRDTNYGSVRAHYAAYDSKELLYGLCQLNMPVQGVAHLQWSPNGMLLWAAPRQSRHIVAWDVRDLRGPQRMAFDFDSHGQAWQGFLAHDDLVAGAAGQRRFSDYGDDEAAAAGRSVCSPSLKLWSLGAQYFEREIQA
ncbi:TPR-like protein [Linderina pennispora]|uniref:TPR-like protein n=1 Tax=Linderina pennispora TaxID=61395 RepID=A0A1Y1W534_9FUNG|nr:TPR-like protein [Linderina pennispora]ORX68512.1 TPR-like protein [Linderina pennispora]